MANLDFFAMFYVRTIGKVLFYEYLENSQLSLFQQSIDMYSVCIYCTL